MQTTAFSLQRPNHLPSFELISRSHRPQGYVVYKLLLEQIAAEGRYLLHIYNAPLDLADSPFLPKPVFSFLDVKPEKCLLNQESSSARQQCLFNEGLATQCWSTS